MIQQWLNGKMKMQLRGLLFQQLYCKTPQNITRPA